MILKHGFIISILISIEGNFYDFLGLFIIIITIILDFNTIIRIDISLIMEGLFIILIIILMGEISTIVKMAISIVEIITVINL